MCVGVTAEGCGPDETMQMQLTIKPALLNVVFFSSNFLGHRSQVSSCICILAENVCEVSCVMLLLDAVRSFPHILSNLIQIS